MLKKLWNFKLQKIVQFYAHISPVFSCWVINLIYLSMYTCICCICNFSQYIFDRTITYHRYTQISWSMHFIHINFYWLHWQLLPVMLNAFVILLCSKLCWHNRLKLTLWSHYIQKDIANFNKYRGMQQDLFLIIILVSPVLVSC